MKKRKIAVLVCLCLAVLASCDGKRQDDPGNTTQGEETSVETLAETTTSTEEDDRQPNPFGFVDDRESGNQTADDPFGGTE